MVAQGTATLGSVIEIQPDSLGAPILINNTCKNLRKTEPQTCVVQVATALSNTYTVTNTKYVLCMWWQRLTEWGICISADCFDGDGVTPVYLAVVIP